MINKTNEILELLLTQTEVVLNEIMGKDSHVSVNVDLNNETFEISKNGEIIKIENYKQAEILKMPFKIYKKYGEYELVDLSYNSNFLMILDSYKELLPEFVDYSEKEKRMRVLKTETTTALKDLNLINSDLRVSFVLDNNNDYQINIYSKRKFLGASMKLEEVINKIADKKIENKKERVKEINKALKRNSKKISEELAEFYEIMNVA